MAVLLALNPVLKAKVLFEEQFDDLSAWKELPFSGKMETNYTTMGGVLQIDSKTTASGMATIDTWSSQDDLYLVWRWRCDKWPTLEDHDLKSGDDYALRVFLIFEKEQNWLEKAIGVRPTECALAYTFSSVAAKVEFRVSPYADNVMIIPLRLASETAGEWFVEKRNIGEDFRRTFDRNMPPHFRLGIMGDTDDSKSESFALIDYIKLVELSVDQQIDQ